MASLRRRLRARLHKEEGSLLIEVLVSASILLTVAAGVVLALQTAQAQSSIQRSKALATDVAQNALDEIRARDFNALRGLNESGTVTEGGVAFNVVSRATPVAQNDAPSGCSTNRSRDYYSVKTTVTWAEMGNRKPVVLDTLVAAPVGAGGGIIAAVTGATGQAIPNIPLLLSSGGGSATTDASGCARWDQVAAGSGYGITGSVAGYVEPDGTQDIAISGITIAAEDTAQQTIAYDRGGSINVTFQERRFGSASAQSVSGTLPDSVTATNASSTVVKGSPTVSGATGTYGLFYPYTSSYQVYADTCPAAMPPPSVVTSGRPTAIVPAGGSVNATLELPSLGLRFTNNGTPPTATNGITVRVKTTCGTIITSRTVRTSADATLTNPGLPYGTGMTVCAQNSANTMRAVVNNVSNTTYAAPTLTSTEVRLTTTGSTCPF
jgi:type II secretory pathway pseudopilin PulG